MEITKNVRPLFIVALALALGVGASMTALAQSVSVGHPAPAATGSGASLVVRPVDPPPTGTDINTITVGSNTALGGPDAGVNNPIPTFSAINSPVWVTTTGNALQVGNDQINHGLVDFHNGLVNSTGVVTVYDDLFINGNTLDTGNVTINGEVTAGLIGGTAAHQLTGNTNIIGNLSISGALSLVNTGATTTIGTTASPSDLVVNGNVRATTIGRVYVKDGNTLTLSGSGASNTWRSTGTYPAGGACPTGIASCSDPCSAGDILLACVANYTSASTLTSSYGTNWYSQPDYTTHTCGINVRRVSTSSSSSNTHVVHSRGTCFSPDG